MKSFCQMVFSLIKKYSKLSLEKVEKPARMPASSTASAAVAATTVPRTVEANLWRQRGRKDKDGGCGPSFLDDFQESGKA